MDFFECLPCACLSFGLSSPISGMADTDFIRALLESWWSVEDFLKLVEFYIFIDTIWFLYYCFIIQIHKILQLLFTYTIKIKQNTIYLIYKNIEVRFKSFLSSCFSGTDGRLPLKIRIVTFSPKRTKLISTYIHGSNSNY